MSDETKTEAEQAVAAVAARLKSYWAGHRQAWMHGIIKEDFDRGQVYALSSLVLIPELRKVLDTFSEQMTGELEAWHKSFESDENKEK